MADINVRELALEILIKVLEEGEYSSVLIPKVLSNYQYIEKRDRAFLNRLCEGTIERMMELDYIINQFSSMKVKKMKPVIRNILRMGVYQLKYMEHIPASAACNEAVKLAQKRGFRNLKGFVNGVLRNINRNLDKIVYPDKQKQFCLYESVRYSMPEWIVQLWLEQYGAERTETMLQASFAERMISVRCNLAKNTVAQLKTKLEQEAVTVQHGNYVETALQLTNYDHLQQLESFQNGCFTVQDESSMLVALAAGIKKNAVVLDVCAAPGGKSLHAADLLSETGMVYARDLTEKKAAKIRENQNRLGVKNMQVNVWDATKEDASMLEKADVVFADVPCSGLGVMGKKNDIKYKVTKEGIESLVALQRKIVQMAEKYVKPQGVFLYSTCTVNQKENTDNVEWILAHTNLELESLDAYIPEALRCETTSQGYLQLMPGIHKTDGFFLARFRKRM